MTKRPTFIKIQVVLEIPLSAAEPSDPQKCPEPERYVEIKDVKTHRWDPPYGTNQ